MNSDQENGAPVAIAGRVPVRVTGRINKGDRLVSAGNGLARAVDAEESINAFNVIGRAYVDSTVSGSGALATSGGTMTGDILISGTVNIGTSGNRVTTVFATTFNGTATTAQYADLAENFVPDSTYAPGTVVALGGVEEITAVNEELSNNVFGVLSERPAYLMNAGQENGAPVAIAGRVPVRVIGRINKGDRLVSAGNGVARAASQDESINAFNVIGRAIQAKLTTGEGTVEAFVTIT
jgi:hypothetical protein